MPVPGMVTEKRKQANVLKNALYRLRQDSSEWDLFLHNFQVQIGFDQSMAGSTLYVCKDGEEFVIVVVYNDNVSLFGSSDGEIAKAVGYFK